MSEKQAPIAEVVAVRRPARAHPWGLYVVACPYCRRDHRHGAGEGHRVAHCVTSTAESERGYMVRLPTGGDDESKK